MIKRFLFLLIAVQIALTSMAQERVSRWSVIPKIGINSSYVTNKDDVDIPISGNWDFHETFRKLGIVIGVDFNYQINKWLRTSFDLCYSNEGYKNKYPKGCFAKTSNRYLDFTVVENFNIVGGLALKSGIILAYLIGASPAERTYDQRNWNLSIPVGISYEYMNVILDLRYNIGLTDIGGWRWDNVSKCKTNSLWLTLGYRIGL